MILDAIYKGTNGTGLKVLTSKQMFQRLPVGLTQGNTSGLLNEIRQIVYSLYQSKQIS